jgi:hypothetical protein
MESASKVKEGKDKQKKNEKILEEDINKNKIFKLTRKLLYIKEAQ